VSEVVSPTVDDVVTDVIAFIQAVLGTTIPCVRGLGNRVPAPVPPFIVVTPLYQERLAYNTDTYSVPQGIPPPPPTQLSVQMSTRIDLQIDAYGPSSGTQIAMLAALWRDDYACNLMVNSQPLYADEARMIPLVDSEAQYEERWSLTATAQYNPVLTPAQLFGDAADINLVDVQEAYPE
jgi:hypothetical protein